MEEYLKYPTGVNVLVELPPSLKDVLPGLTVCDKNRYVWTSTLSWVNSITFRSLRWFVISEDMILRSKRNGEFNIFLSFWFDFWFTSDWRQTLYPLIILSDKHYLRTFTLRKLALWLTDSRWVGSGMTWINGWKQKKCNFLKERLWVPPPFFTPHSLPFHEPSWRIKVRR